MLKKELSQKGNTPITVLVAAIVLTIVGVGLYWYMGMKRPTAITPAPIVQPNQSATPDTSTWRTYSDLTYKYTFKYPTDLELSTSSSETTASDGTIYSGIRIRLQGKEECLLSIGSGVRCFVIDFNFSKYNGDRSPQVVHTSRKIGDLTYYYRNVMDDKDVNGEKIEGENTRVDQYFYEETKQQLFLTIQYRISADDKTSYDNTFDQILSTLKFTD